MRRLLVSSSEHGGLLGRPPGGTHHFGLSPSNHPVIGEAKANEEGVYCWRYFSHIFITEYLWWSGVESVPIMFGNKVHVDCGGRLVQTSRGAVLP